MRCSSERRRLACTNAFALGGIASEVSTNNRSEDYDYNENYPPPPPAAGTIYNETATEFAFPLLREVLSTTEANKLAVPDKNVTAEELDKLGSDTRKRLSDNLVRQAIHLVKNLGENSKAKAKQPIINANEKVIFAIEVSRGNTPAFEAYASVLYDYRYFKETVQYLSDLESWIVKSNQTQMYIGMSNLRLENYTKARDAFLYINNREGSNSTYFNLGLAYNGLKQYDKSAEAFESALQFKANDVDTHYGLGFAYYKLKNKEAFNRQYAILLDWNSVKASQLLENSYKLKPSAGELQRSRVIE